MGCVSARQRQRAKAIKNFPQFDWKKQTEFETMILPAIREMQTKHASIEAVRQALSLAKNAQESDKDPIKIQQLESEFKTSWDNLRKLYKNSIEKLEFCMHEYDDKNLDQNKLSKILLDLGADPNQENRNMKFIQEILQTQSKFYGDEGYEITEDQYNFSREHLESDVSGDLSLENSILALGSVVTQVGEIGKSPKNGKSTGSGGSCEGTRKIFRKKKINFT